MMQSVDLSFARYKFFEENNINITMDNYKKLFVPQKDFISQYKINNKELIEKYNYEYYIKEKNDGKII